MPEFELGAVAWSRPDVGIGFVARTSLEYRPAVFDTPCARLTYDAATAPFSAPARGGEPAIDGALSTHEVLIGGGWRGGSATLQGGLGLQGGLVRYALPRVIVDDGLTVSARTRSAAAARASVGCEVYVAAESALTLEVYGRRLWGDDWQGRDGFAVAALVGFTSPL